MQGLDVDRAVQWLSLAGNNNLVRLAAKAERFLVQAGAHLSGRPEAAHIPQSSLLRMLDSRYAAIEGMQQIARGCAHQCYCAKAPRCSANHKAVMPDAVRVVAVELRALAPTYQNV